MSAMPSPVGIFESPGGVRSTELVRAANRLVELIDKPLLFIRWAGGITDDVDKQNVRDFEPRIRLESSRHSALILPGVGCELKFAKRDARRCVAEASLARMGSATTSQQFIRQIGAALGISAFVLAATVGGFRLGLLLMIAVSAGTFACVLALPAHSLHDAHQIDALE